MIDGIIEYKCKDRRILVYGAGIHTEKLFEMTCLRNMNIVGIVDKELNGSERYGYNVISPEEINNLDSDAVLISSFKFQGEIEDDLNKKYSYKGEIIKLYDSSHTYPFYLELVTKNPEFKFRSKEDLTALLQKYSSRKIAVLLDGTVDYNELMQYLPDSRLLTISGFYSFNFELINEKIGDQLIGLLNRTGAVIDVDAWIVCSKNTMESFSLCRYLLQRGCDSQNIIRLVRNKETTSYYSYVDFFHNKTQSVVYVHNYLHRCYGLPFPIDIKYTLKDLEGEIKKCGQFIIPTDGIKKIDSSSFGVEDFVGYLEIEYEIDRKVQPFLHYMVDYISDAYISSNHQSGLGVHPANSRFTRGYIPVDPNKSLHVCVFQKDYETLDDVTLNLYYFENGEKKHAVKLLPPLKRFQMLYRDVKDHFSEIDFMKVDSPYVEVVSKSRIHRPNYYYFDKKQKTFYDTSHAGPDMGRGSKSEYQKRYTKIECDKFESIGVETFHLTSVVFPDEFGIDTLLVLGNDTTEDINEFTLRFYSETGEVVHKCDIFLNYEKERFFNISKLIKDNNIHLEKGCVVANASINAKAVPLSLNAITAYKSRSLDYITTTAASGAKPDNLPFYYRAGPPNYIQKRAPMGVGDIYARGVCDENYDTLFTVIYRVSERDFLSEITYEVEIVNSKGESRKLTRSLNANGVSYLRLSELLVECRFSDDYGTFAVWLFASQGSIYAQHILMRKKDGAIALEHCYPGRYGF